LAIMACVQCEASGGDGIQYTRARTQIHALTHTHMSHLQTAQYRALAFATRRARQTRSGNHTALKHDTCAEAYRTHGALTRSLGVRSMYVRTFAVYATRSQPCSLMVLARLARSTTASATTTPKLSAPWLADLERCRRCLRFDWPSTGDCLHSARCPASDTFRRPHDHHLSCSLRGHPSPPSGNRRPGRVHRRSRTCHECPPGCRRYTW